MPHTPVPIVTDPPQGGVGGTIGATQLLDVANISITVPADWTVAQQDAKTLDIRRPGGGQLVLNSFRAKDGTTVQGIIDNLVTTLQGQAPDLKYCVAANDLGPIHGPTGKSFQLCYTATSQSGNTFFAYDLHQIGLDGANNLYWATIYADQQSNNAAVTEFFDAMNKSLKWKLYDGQTGSVPTQPPAGPTPQPVGPTFQPGPGVTAAPVTPNPEGFLVNGHVIYGGWGLDIAGAQLTVLSLGNDLNAWLQAGRPAEAVIAQATSDSYGNFTFDRRIKAADGYPLLVTAQGYKDWYGTLDVRGEGSMGQILMESTGPL